MAGAIVKPMQEALMQNLELELPTPVEPSDGERMAALLQPGGCIYRFSGPFAPTDAIPPEAIFGAWQVDDDGNIVGEFMRNPNYDPQRYPPLEEAAGPQH